MKSLIPMRFCQSFKIFSLLFFSIGSTCTINGQSLDSLYQIWTNESEHDTTRLKALGLYAEDGFLFSNPDTAFYLLQLQYDYAESKGLFEYMGHALSKQAFSYLIRSRYFDALDYYQKSLNLREEHNDVYGIIGSLNGIGIIYSVLHDYEKSLEYYKQVIKMNEEELGNPRVEAGTKINIATSYYELNDLDKAFDLSTNGIKLCEAIGENRFLANGLDLRGKVNYELGDITQAKIDLNKAMQIFNEIGDYSGLSESSVNLGKLNLNLGNYQKTIELCSKSLELGIIVESLREQKTACECLYSAYKNLGNEKKALAYHEKMLVAKDGLLKEDASKELQKMEFQKKVLADSLTAVEEAQMVQQKHEEEVRRKNKTRNIFAGAGLLFLLLSGGLYSRWRFVRRSKAIIEEEKNRSENLLLNILPAEIAKELKEKGKADARDFEMVSILFTDFKDFTEQGAKLSASELVNEINFCFEGFDAIMGKYGIEKIKTIGDAYMAAGGLPIPSDDSVKRTVLAALEMQDFISKRRSEMVQKGKPSFEMRVGIHTGPVVAGIVGVKKFQYDIWGDTVNTASRVENLGEPGKVNISKSTYDLIKDDPDFSFESRGQIEAKGKGEIEMYFVSKI